MEPEDVDQHIGVAVYRVIDFGAITHAVASVFTDQPVETLRQRVGVRYVESDETCLEQTRPCGIDRVAVEVAHANGETSAGEDIAIIDTGINDDNPDLHSVKIPDNSGLGIVDGLMPVAAMSRWWSASGHSATSAGLLAQ